MTARTCAGCGVAEQRQQNAIGEVVKTNLDPFSGYCVSCLGKMAKEATQQPEPEPFDARKAAAGRDE